MTERLSLRRATDDDAAAFWRYRRLPDVAEWLPLLTDDWEEFRTYITKADRLARTLVVERDGTVIGDLMLRLEDAWAQHEVADRAQQAQAELGWALDPAHHGHGYATEAVRALLRVCFADLGLRRVEAQCFADNAPSWRLMERVGMRRESHTVADSLHRSGAWLDGLGYAMLAQEWRTANG
ncbi:GCN5-related protein N-acetyltransferase [Beutenbergia cavernae DSM 12333]|uniref:GCN5-related protein N-acetyltransferase n=1 Tax=Beutenbergia cavernae (strain ATCC BAA-8 / DSM 12333 / CCUG 43141 / JCM 11478 / NBRC 16432 / NCIMB 13614 / HKI 0122) TaxID=471853 RepID=C5BXJ3_BEUC1|nr:GCN5-related protein N-acetyltransferase [Beutenbergia cavernae DSM 12333]